MTTFDVSITPTPTNLHEYLATVEEARRSQLESIPEHSLDPADAAHRATLEKIVEEVQEARRRLAAGLYGVCARCERPIPAERLEFRPWAVRCTPCSA